MADPDFWRRCSACKQPIDFGADYWACSVSTCNRKRTALAFCTVDCWEIHLPGANHREAWAVEKKAPASAAAAQPEGRTSKRDGGEVFIVASRLKDYVKKSAGYNTSDRVLAPLSAIVQRICDRAIDNARREGRMTVLERDIPDDL